MTKLIIPAGVDVDADNTMIRTIDNQLWWIDEIRKPEGRRLLLAAYTANGLSQDDANALADRVSTLEWRELLFEHFVRFGMQPTEAANSINQMPHLPPPYTDRNNFSMIWGKGNPDEGFLTYYGMFKFAEGPATMDVPLIKDVPRALEELIQIQGVDPNNLRIFTAREEGEAIWHLEKRLHQESLRVDGNRFNIFPGCFKKPTKVTDRNFPKADQSLRDGYRYLIDDNILSHLASAEYGNVPSIPQNPDQKKIGLTMHELDAEQYIEWFSNPELGRAIGLMSRRVGIVPAVPYKLPKENLSPEEQTKLAQLFLKLPIAISGSLAPTPAGETMRYYKVRYAPTGILEAVDIIRKDLKAFGAAYS